MLGFESLNAAVPAARSLSDNQQLCDFEHGQFLFDFDIETGGRSLPGRAAQVHVGDGAWRAGEAAALYRR